jgi:hypothetical protein
MKAIYSVTLLFLLVMSFAAQSPIDNPKTPNALVLQKGWRVEVSNPELDDNPFRSIEENEREKVDRETLKRTNQMRERLRLPPIQKPIPNQAPEKRKNDGLSRIYTYETKIKNTGEKVIHRVIWEYIFFEPNTNQEVGYRQFLSQITIPPGKIKSLFIRTAMPPSDTINIAYSGKKLREQYSEQVNILRIEYADGSIWESSP